MWRWFPPASCSGSGNTWSSWGSPVQRGEDTAVCLLQGERTSRSHPGQLTTPTVQRNPELQCMDKGRDPEQLHCKEGAFLLPIAPVWLCSKFGLQKMLLRVGRKWAPVLGKKPFPKHLSPAGVPHPSHLCSHLHLAIPYSSHSHCLYGLHVYCYSPSREIPQPYPLPHNSPTGPKLASSVCTWTAGISGRNDHGGWPTGLPSP